MGSSERRAAEEEEEEEEERGEREKYSPGPFLKEMEERLLGISSASKNKEYGIITLT